MEKSKNIFYYSLFIIFSTIVLSFQNSTENKKNSFIKTESNKSVITNTLPTDPSKKDQSGKALYKKYCLTCHQLNGSGVPGTFPPLGKGSWVGKNPTDLIKIILKGLSGEIEVNGEYYKNSMPLQNKITNEELANVLTYIRSNFGNNFEPITPDMVKNARNAKQ